MLHIQYLTHTHTHTHTHTYQLPGIHPENGQEEQWKFTTVRHWGEDAGECKNSYFGFLIRQWFLIDDDCNCCCSW
jgi:hypothetical protein